MIRKLVKWSLITLLVVLVGSVVYGATREYPVFTDDGIRIK